MPSRFKKTRKMHGDLRIISESNNDVKYVFQVRSERILFLSELRTPGLRHRDPIPIGTMTMSPAMRITVSQPARCMYDEAQ